MPILRAFRARTATGALLAVSLLAALPGCGGHSDHAPATIVYQPNTDLQLPLPDGSFADVADPHAIKVGDTWHLYGTHTMQNLESWSSVDLATWRYDGVIWQPTPGTWNDRGNIWAPHVQPAPDGYYLYYAANGKVGVAKASAPVGPFVDVYNHPLAGGGYGGIGDGVYISAHYDVNDPADFLNDFQEYAIDPYVHHASDGSLTLYMAILTPFSVIAAVPMLDYVTLANTPTTVVLDMSPDAPWESVNREAPAVIESNGVFHLLYSGNLWWTADYALGAAAATTTTATFARQEHNPVLAQDPQHGLFGPGHCSVVAGAFDDLLIFYHAKVDAVQYSARRTRYAPIVVNAAGELEIQLKH